MKCRGARRISHLAAKYSIQGWRWLYRRDDITMMAARVRADLI